MIPAIAEYLKNKAVSFAVREDVFPEKIHKYSIFSKKRFMRCDLWLYQDKEKGRTWYNVLIRCPEVYDELANAIRQKGLKNVNICGENKYYSYFIISTWINYEYLKFIFKNIIIIENSRKYILPYI